MNRNSNLYNQLIGIEERHMQKECRQLDEAESIYVYTRNQFSRETKRLLDHDEALTFKYKMIQLAKISKDCFNRLNCEWSEFADIRLKDIKNNIKQK